MSTLRFNDTALPASVEMETRLKIEQVCLLVGWGRSKIYLEMKRGAFPAPERRGRCIRWRAGDVVEWLRSIGANSLKK